MKIAQIRNNYKELTQIHDKIPKIYETLSIQYIGRPYRKNFLVVRHS